MKFLFVGGPDHGVIKDIQPQSPIGIWQTVKTASTNDFLQGNIHDMIYTYWAKKFRLFDTHFTVMLLNGEEDPDLMIDAMLRPDLKALLKENNERSDT